MEPPPRGTRASGDETRLLAFREFRSPRRLDRVDQGCPLVPLFFKFPFPVVGKGSGDRSKRLRGKALAYQDGREESPYSTGVDCHARLRRTRNDRKWAFRSGGNLLIAPFRHFL